MTNYAYSQTLIRLAENPELDPHQDKVFLLSSQTSADGYAREDNRWVLAAGATVDLDFDAFADGEWLDLAVQNEGSAEASIMLTDDVGVQFTTPIPVKACLLMRCYKTPPKPGDPIAQLSSTLGTRVRVFAWGEHWEGEPQ